MAKLSTKDRKKLPAKDFAGPGRSYPVEDKAHARNAKARASEMAAKGKLSAAEKAKIDRKADAKLGKKAAEGPVAKASKPTGYAKVTPPPKGCTKK